MTAETTPAPAGERHAFQAEVQQLLNIVIHSIYTDKEVFVRELVSNAADALEKRRYESLQAGKPTDALDIVIETDDIAKTFAIRDTGVGMTREEMVAGLGTIAHSGTRAFLAKLAEGGGKDVGLIGQFGVGFYSVFMVAEKVTVESRSWQDGATGHVWESDGSGTYSIEPKEGLEPGTRITLTLRDGEEQFSRASDIQRILRRYSSFVPFPIRLGGEAMNTLQAVWAKNPRDVKDEEYNEFFHYIAGSADDPLYKLHFSSDVPIDLKALIYVPTENLERFGFGKMTPQVDLYCKKVLIQKHPEELLPAWMRFVRGVVDSEDLPLNIARESMQDSQLLRRIASAVTSRFLKFLAEQAKENPEQYKKFYATFGAFLKEGVTSDFQHQRDLAGLLRFESSKTTGEETTSLAEYVERMGPDQKDIYFLNGASREAIEAGPYLEIFKARDIEVLYTKDAADDYVLQSLMMFSEKSFRSGDSPDVKLDPLEGNADDSLSRADAEALCGWMRKQLEGRVGSVRVSSRLVTNPAMVVGDGMMTNAMRRMMTLLGREEAPDASSLTLEINPAHPFVVKLNALRQGDEELAKLLSDQLLDGVLLGAGLLSDAQGLVERMNKVLLRAAK